MTIVSGNLDSLVGTTYGGDDAYSLAVQSFTTVPSSNFLTADMDLGTLTANVAGPSSLEPSVFSYEITSVTDSQNLVSVEQLDDGQAIGTMSYNVVGSTPGGTILLALDNSSGGVAEALTQGETQLIDDELIAVSTSALATNSTVVFDGIACFAAGTRIATGRGDIVVEDLRLGDWVALAEGGFAPVTWLGHRRVACRRHPRPEAVQPVRIAAHAFGLGRPARDLVLSPDHAVFVDGVLIPVRYLVNDATVRQEDVAHVTYWHVELPAHAALLAEGLPAESYLDSGNRAAFANGGGVAMAHPNFARAVWARDGFAPLATSGPLRDQVYRRLLAQACSLGWRRRDAGGGATLWQAPLRREVLAA